VVKSNLDALVRVAVEGQVSHPGQRGGFTVGFDDRPQMRPGMAGVTVNLRVGARALGWECDHGEPGVSAEGLNPDRHLALQVLAALGNRVRMTSGLAQGALGTVTGKHAFVLIDFPAEVLAEICPGDRLVVEAWGQGLQLTDHPEVTVRNLGPELLGVLGLESGADSRLRVPVVATLPSRVMGAGIGMSSEWANCDVMLHDADLVDELGLANLRLGDLVAMEDQDHRYGRSFHRGWTSVGVIAHALGPTPGHGVGVVTILSAPAAALATRAVPRINIGDLLGLS